LDVGFIGFFIVICRSIDIQQSELAEDTQAQTGRINHFLALFAIH
jgi:hypothetical protein